MAGVAQGLERLTVAQEVVGSRPIIRPIKQLGRPGRVLPREFSPKINPKNLLRSSAPSAVNRAWHPAPQVELRGSEGLPTETPLRLG